MMPVELNGNLLKELRGRTCRILSAEGWTQSNLGSALGVSQVMAGNYLHTLSTRYSEPIESNLQEASLSLAEILKSEEVSTQIIPRDRHAFFFSVLGIISCKPLSKK